MATVRSLINALDPTIQTIASIKCAQTLVYLSSPRLFGRPLPRQPPPPVASGPLPLLCARIRRNSGWGRHVCVGPVCSVSYADACTARACQHRPVAYSNLATAGDGVVGPGPRHWGRPAGQPPQSTGSLLQVISPSILRPHSTVNLLLV